MNLMACSYVYHTHRLQRNPEEGGKALETEVKNVCEFSLMWVLGTQPKSSAKQPLTVEHFSSFAKSIFFVCYVIQIQCK